MMVDFITLQFSTTESSIGNWASALIRRLIHSPFSHVNTELPDGNLLGATDSPDAPVISGNPRGVAVRPPNYQKFGRRRRMIIKTNKAEAIIEAQMDQLGKPFDGSALLDFVSDSFPDSPDSRDWRDSKAWFCAELCCHGFEAGGYWFPKPLVWPKNRVSPTDLLLLFLFDDNWVNRDTFWNPIEGLTLHPHER